ncbi:BON domain-containing protein [Pseudomonas sp. R3-56]|uniref:BON domain-containing protein n=1 Tax=Pseudomonas sp. R3-56 TaxID=2817401 RepID=UPI003DA89898
MNDLDLRRSILDELEFCAHLDDAANIGVSVENGIVSLTGHVHTYTQKKAVEQAVRRLRGVRAIAEEIEIRRLEDQLLSDDVIAARCLDVIRWNAVIPEDQIQINVQRGAVRLEGEVDWQYQKQAAERAVHALAGVVSIENRLAIRDRDSANDIKGQIEASMGRHAGLNANDIHVCVEGGTVKLEGRVRLWREREAAEQAAWAAPGVKHVENYLLIA